MMKMTITAMLTGLLGTPLSSEAALATFDSLAEGFCDQHFQTGGIQFFGVDSHRSIGPGGTFVIEDASNTLSYSPVWAAAFSSPNWLAMTALSPGPMAAPTRFGEVSMSTGQIETTASVDVLISDRERYDNPPPAFQYSDCSIVLEAYLDNQLVASASTPLGYEADRYEQLRIENVSFDTLRLAATAPVDADRAFFFGAIDNVLITPEPTTALLLLLTILLVRPKA